MGGYRSGFRGHRKERAELTPSIRIEAIKHLLKPGVDSVTLDCKRYGRSSTHTFKLSSVKGGYGDRSMFVCPTCQKTCAVLYGVTLIEHPQCRKCSNLNYVCQWGDALYRIEVVLRKEYRKLTNELIPSLAFHAPAPYLLPKPKGMHWKTYAALCQRILKLQEEWSKAFLVRVQRDLSGFKRPRPLPTEWGGRPL